jgi:hypothetical protein
MTTTLEQTIHNEQTQRLDARGVAKLYGVKLPVIAKAIGASPDALRKHPDSSPVQDRLAILVDCFARIYDVMSQDESAVRRWLCRPNRALDGMRPLTLLETARLSELKAIATQVGTGGFA